MLFLTLERAPKAGPATCFFNFYIHKIISIYNNLQPKKELSKNTCLTFFLSQECRGLQGYDNYVKDVYEIENAATDKQWIIQISDINYRVARLNKIIYENYSFQHISAVVVWEQ